MNNPVDRRNRENENIEKEINELSQNESKSPNTLNIESIKEYSIFILF